jgi:DNA-binding NtrC family response regulator
MSEAEKKQVLGVVYDHIMGKSLKRMFERKEYEVEIIESRTDTSEEVRKKLNERIFNVLLTEFSHVNPKGVIEAGQEKNVPIMIIMDGGRYTAKDQELLRELIESGVVKTIPKPFSPQELFELIDREALKEVLQSDIPETKN